MERIEDYNELNKLQKGEGREVLVLFSDLVHRVVEGEWKVVGKVDLEGKVKYLRRYDTHRSVG